MMMLNDNNDDSDDAAVVCYEGNPTRTDLGGSNKVGESTGANRIPSIGSPENLEVAFFLSWVSNVDYYLCMYAYLYV